MSPGRILSAILVPPMIGLIRLYRLTLSPLIGQQCRFDPSCSRYTEEAIRRHGPFWGVWLGAIRISRCNPFGGVGYDPVPDDPRPKWWIAVRRSGASPPGRTVSTPPGRTVSKPSGRTVSTPEREGSSADPKSPL